MVKDRLGDFIKAQDGQYKTSNARDVEKGETPSQGGSSSEFRKTFERAEVLGQWIVSIEENVEAIRQYFNKLDDLKIDQRDLRDKIESLFQNNASICQKITGRLKEFDEEIKYINTESAEGRIKSIQYNTLKTRYQKIFKQSNAELENYKNIQKTQLEAQLRSKGVTVTDEELVCLLEEKQDIQLFTDNIIAETAEAKRMLADINERHQRLLKIERMLEEVRDLFLQMSILIDNQQELIDRIEYQAETTQNFVIQGKKDLEKGEKKKKRYLKRKIYVTIAILFLIALILVLIFKT